MIGIVSFLLKSAVEFNVEQEPCRVANPSGQML